LAQGNDAGSTPLHWAALNSHLSCVQKLVLFPDGPGIDLIDIKNVAGHSPLAEAEFAGWDEGAQWLVEKMNLEGVVEQQGGAEDEIEADPAILESEGEKSTNSADGAEDQLAEMNLKSGDS
jgi:uncharacterized protein